MLPTSQEQHTCFQNLKKTGTTICAYVFKNGAALAAGTRSKNGEVVAEKNGEKIH